MILIKHVRNFVIFFWNLRNVHRYEISHSHSHAKVHYSQKIRKIIGNFTKLYSILYNFVKFYTIIWIFIQVYKCLCNYTKFRISHSHAKFLYNYSYLWIREKKIRFRTSLKIRCYIYRSINGIKYLSSGVQVARWVTFFPGDFIMS